MALKVVGYVRVSTDEQHDSGAGLEAQRSQIRETATRRAWNLIAIREDAASGKSLTARPGLQVALADVENGNASALVVAKLDRLSRSLLDFASLMERSRRKRPALVICWTLRLSVYELRTRSSSLYPETQMRQFRRSAPARRLTLTDVVDTGVSRGGEIQLMERELARTAAHGVAVLRCAPEVSRNVLRTYRCYGITCQSVYKWRRYEQLGRDRPRDRSSRRCRSHASLAARLPTSRR